MNERTRRALEITPDGPLAPPWGFDRIAIVGLGLIGGSVALAARRANASVFIAGVDSPEALRQAVERGLVDVASERLDVVADADLVILAAPVLQNIRLIPQVARRVPARAIVTDVGSTKRATVDAARALGRTLTFVGGHPVAGAAAGGIAHARMDLFEGRPWLFTPDEDAKGAPLERLFAFARSLGAAPHALSAVEHDRVMAFVSHLPQLTASALMRVAGDGAGETGLSLSGPGLADTTRLAASPFGIWADICATNAEAIGAALDRLISELSSVRAGLAEPDRLAELFCSASAWRERLRVLSSSRTTGASLSSPGAPIPNP